MSAPVTEAQYQLAHQIRQSSTQERAAQLIADSEAKACLVAVRSVNTYKNIAFEVATERDQLRAELVATLSACSTETYRAERAEAELAVANASIVSSLLYNTLKERLFEAEAELATERARLADLIADLNDACITLASAAEDCDDYAMQNTGFKLTAVRDVLLQHIPDAAMKEGSK